ncbi:MAG TPA: heparan-alpha-glucosaminide N-acetyltransferase domain-containing protein [Puia sp.]
MKRIYSIDFTRGLVMIIMTLDHTRDFLHVNSIIQNPTDLSTTTPLLFFTRWITHLCAPIFVFLSGLSAWLSLKNRSDARENRRFLFKRGIWLIILEFSFVNFALWMDIQFRTLIFEVIGAIGAGFIILSLLYKFPPRILGITGIIIIFLHDLFSPAMLSSIPALKFIESLFITNGVFQPDPHLLFIIGYPVLPWLGIMLAGFACGRLFDYPDEVRKRIFLRTGLAALALFIIIRFSNIYGDPSPWLVQKDSVFTFLSFMNITKYPPSLLFTLATLGIMFLFLFLSEGKNNKFTQVVSVYGKTPLFYFLLHLYIIHLGMFLMVFLQGFHAKDLQFGFAKVGRPAEGSGIGLPSVYLAWLAVLILTYPLCRRYGLYKSSHRDNKWLRYL